MILIIILSVVLISFVLGFILSKSCFGNMDKEYYEEIENVNGQTEKDIEDIILFGLTEEGDNYD